MTLQNTDLLCLVQPADEYSNLVVGHATAVLSPCRIIDRDNTQKRTVVQYMVNLENTIA